MSTDKKIPTFFSSVSQSFSTAELVSSDGIITPVFLDACQEIIPLLDKLDSTAFAPAKTNIDGNINRIRQKYSSNPQEFATLQKIMRYEIKANVAKEKYSTTLSILWLKRALEFLCELLKEINTGELDIAKCVYTAYERALKQHHSFMVKGFFNLAIQAVTNRRNLLSHLAVTECDVTSTMFEDSLKKDIENYVKNLDSILQILNKMFKDNDLDSKSILSIFIY